MVCSPEGKLLLVVCQRAQLNGTRPAAPYCSLPRQNHPPNTNAAMQPPNQPTNQPEGGVVEAFNLASIQHRVLTCWQGHVLSQGTLHLLHRLCCVLLRCKASDLALQLLRLVVVVVLQAAAGAAGAGLLWLLLIRELHAAVLLRHPARDDARCLPPPDNTAWPDAAGAGVMVMLVVWGPAAGAASA